MKCLDKDSPFSVMISFHRLLEFYEEQARSDDEFIAMKARRVLEVQRPYPELREGFTDEQLLDTHADVIEVILRDTFSPALTHNEIKIASIPFEDVIIYATERFKNIVSQAGEGFDLKMRKLGEDNKYIMACAVILKAYYNVNVNFQRPVFYDIPDASTILRHYRVLYNADYLDIYPTDRAVELSAEDIEELLNNFDNPDLWKEKFPPQSWVLKGFGICNMYDATMDNVISDLKTTLIGINSDSEINFVENFQFVICHS